MGSRAAGPERLGEVLGRAVIKPARRGRTLLGRAQRKWDATVEAAVAAHSRPRTFRRGLLTVEVDSSALLAELSGFRRAGLVHKLAGEPEPLGVRDIKFVLAEE
jgi:predicted nucleic acid-binding Zn ribbon protein